MFAIVRTGGKQYRVQQGDRIAVERLDVDEGAELTLEDVLLVGEGEDVLEDVLLVGEGEDVTVGAPVVTGASVTARVAEHFRDPKVLSFKYKNKTRQRTLHGHRQQRTRLEILEISGG